MSTSKAPVGAEARGRTLSKPRRPGGLVGALGGAAVGGALVLLGLRLGAALGHDHQVQAGGLDLDAAEELALLIVALAGIAATLLVHELGHLGAGRAVGFRAYLLVIGPFRFERSVAGWRVARNRSIALAGGLAGAAPTDERALRSRVATMVAGGPATSLLTGALALLACRALDPLAFTGATPFGWVLLAGATGSYGITSLLIGLVTLFPVRTSSFQTDGAQLLTLLRGGAEAERAAAISALVGLSLAGTRPRDLPPGLIAAAMVPADGSTQELNAWQIAQAAAADRGDHGEARALLEGILAQLHRLVPVAQAAQRYDAAAQLARWGDLAGARAEFEAAGAVDVHGAAYLVPLARGAILALEGDRASARAQLAEARALVGRSMDRGSIAPMLDLIAELESRPEPGVR